MLISIVILSYNDFPGTTGPCLASLAQDPDFQTWEVIVVDNASNQETISSLREAELQYPSVKFIFNPHNSGYAAGNNVGIRASTGQIVVLLNSDTEVPPGMMPRLSAHFVRHPDAGMVGAVTNAAGNEQCLMSVETSIPTKLGEGLRFADAGTPTELEAERMDFFCVAISRNALNKVGLLDEDFGRGYFEDFDYSLRVRKAGFRQLVAEDAFVYHRGSASFSQLPAQVRQLFKRNKRRVIEKHGRVHFPHLRDGNLSILRQYVHQLTLGETIPAYRIENRIALARARQPNSLLKRWLYLHKLGKIERALEPYRHG